MIIMMGSRTRGGTKLAGDPAVGGREMGGGESDPHSD